MPNAGFPTVSILNGLGNGTFAAPVTIVLPNNAQRLRDVGDVDLDGWADLGVITSPPGGQGSLVLLRNDRNGGFQPPTEIIGPIGVGFTTNADFNGDGRPDLVAIGFQINQVLIMEGDGAGGFTQVASYLTGPGQNHLVVLDLNGDERPDIVGTIRGAVYTLLNVCAGDTGTSVDLATTITGPASASAGDTLTFTVTTTNNGPDAASAATITIAVPTGMEYVSSAGLSCSELWGTVSCPAPPLPSDGEVEFTVQVSATGAGSRIIRAMATAAEADSEPSNDIGSATTAIAAGPVTFVVTNTLDGAKGSLRVAIGDANNNPGSINTIAFNIPGTGPFTIAPLSQLPSITTPVIIDGTTQPGYTNAPIIELSGVNVGGTGLNINAGNSTVRGLAVNRWGSGVVLNTNGNNVIEGNYIGTNVAGTAAAANTNGIVANSPNNRIGGTTAAQRNIISGNTGNGLSLSGSNNTVLGNYIGTNPAGTVVIGNGFSGVATNGIGNTIGGDVAGAGNVITGNGAVSNGAGVHLFGGSGNFVRGNFIGTNPAGNAAMPNAYNGVVVQNSNNNIVGGTTPGARNIISGNGIAPNVGHGVDVIGTASGNQITGNYIGTDVTGAVALPNRSNGVNLSSPSTSTTIGGTTAGAGNVIAFNTQNGINVGTGTGNAIRNNAIFSNSSLGIDLGGNGPTANDAGDADTGANNLQNYPVITLASAGSVSGSFNSTASSSFSLDFFASSTCDISGFGEGQRYLGSTSVSTDATGNTTFEATLAGLVSGEVVTATATSNATGNTSEFSACLTAAGGGQTFVVNTTADSGAGSLRQAIIDANATSGTLDTISFNLPGTAPFIIAPTTFLPGISAPVIIDGTTQPGYAGTPLIELDGTNAGGGTNAFFVNASDTVIRGLALIRFGTGGSGTCPPCPASGGGGIVFQGNRNRVENTYVGVRTDGITPAGNRTDGIWILGNQNIVSGNVISGNGWRGIELSTWLNRQHLYREPNWHQRRGHSGHR